MSTADLDLFGPPDGDESSPRFTTVLRGFDPDQVRNYVLHLQARLDSLEKDVEDALSQRDAARRRYTMARDDAYNQLASRMAELLKVADQQADRVRREAEEEAKRRVVEARQLAQQVQRESEADADRLRQQAQEQLSHAEIEAKDLLSHANAERERILGGLSASRDATVAELLATRDHMTSVIQQLEVAVAVAAAAQPDYQPAQWIERGTDGTDNDSGNGDASNQSDPDDGDLLERVEGFEIMLPEFMAREDPDQAPPMPTEP